MIWNRSPHGQGYVYACSSSFHSMSSISTSSYDIFFFFLSLLLFFLFLSEVSGLGFCPGKKEERIIMAVFAEAAFLFVIVSRIFSFSLVLWKYLVFSQIFVKLFIHPLLFVFRKYSLDIFVHLFNHFCPINFFNPHHFLN